MIIRLAYAYNVLAATAGTVVIVVLGVALRSELVGVTRQPLPLVWPAAAMAVVLSQLPLRDVLHPFDVSAVRAASPRAIRAAVCSFLLIWIGFALVYPIGDHEFTTFSTLLATVGFGAAAGGRSDAWAWTLSTGMLIIGFMYITPLGLPIGRALESVPVTCSLMLLILSVIAYVALPRTGRRAGR